MHADIHLCMCLTTPTCSEPLLGRMYFLSSTDSRAMRRESTFRARSASHQDTQPEGVDFPVNAVRPWFETKRLVNSGINKNNSLALLRWSTGPSIFYQNSKKATYVYNQQQRVFLWMDKSTAHQLG